MEVFSVFATLSLVDMISGPLDRVRRAMRSVEGGVATLGQRMGNLALAMAPVALAAGVMLGALGSCVGVAAGFEDQMAKVGAVSRASSEEMAALEATARELGATTQFTAVQVGEAEQYLAMAGFSAKENIAALPGVLNLAAATATDLGRAADISSDILSAFGMKAEEMTRVADVLALTCATANTNMELLGDTMKYVAPVARMAGLSLEETAAMAGLLGNVGIKGSQAGTTLKAMLNKMAAPTKEAQELFQKLGVTVKDSAGNLRSPVTVLGEMAAGLEKMGTAEQIAAMKTIVGEEAIAGFSELIQKEGIGAIAAYAKQLEAGGGSAAEMASRMNDTLAGSLRGLGSAWESVQITVGKLFIPAVRGAVDGMTGFLRLLDKAAQTPFGAALLKIVSAVSLAVVALTGLSAAIWFFSSVGPMLAKALAPAKAALLGLGAPVYAVIAVLGLLYAAYRTQFWRHGRLPARMLEQDNADGQGRAFRVPDAQGRQRRNPGRAGYANQGRRAGGSCDHGFPRGVPHSGRIQGIQQGAFQCLCAHRRYFCARASGRGRTHAGAFRSVRPVHGQRSDQRRLVLGSLRRGPGRDRGRRAGRTGHGLCLAGGRSEAVCFRHRAPDRRRFGAVRLAAGPWRGHE